MSRIAMNTTGDGICRTILATYHKIGTYNVFEHDFPAVMEIYENKDDKKGMLVQRRVYPSMGGLTLFNSDQYGVHAKEGIAPTLRAGKADAAVCVEEELYEDNNSRRLQPEHPEGTGCDRGGDHDLGT